MPAVLKTKMHAAVVGAGIMGLVLALRLVKQGWQITLFEKSASLNTLNNCSLAAAGLLTPSCEMDKAEPLIFMLGREALDQHWPKILNELEQAVFFQTLGCIVVHHPQDQDEWQHFKNRISSKLDQVDITLLNETTIAQLEPGLRSFACGYFFPHEGQIDAQTLVEALVNELRHCGSSLEFDTPVLSLESFQVRTNRTTHTFDWVFDCRGLSAKEVFSDLRGLRGELVWLHAPEVQLQRPVRFLHPRYSIYIAPRPGQRFLLGASELEAEDFSNISLRTVLELLSAAYCLNPAFSEARVMKTVTQCRPALPENLPAIKSKRGLTAINGLYRHGFLIAPTLAEEVLRETYSKPRQYPELWDDL